MKKSLKLMLLIGLFSPLVVKAASVTLACPSSTKAGGEVTCNIEVNSTETVGGFEASVSASSGLKYKSYQKGEGWDGTSSSSKFLVYGKDFTGKLVLGSYTYTVDTTASGNLTVSLGDILVSDADGEELSSNGTASDTIKVLSEVNTLTNLTVEGGNLEFNENTTTYDMTIDNSVTNIVATKKDSNSTVSGDVGSKTLKYGKNTFKINVKSEAGTTKTYTINITRPDNRNTVNTLSSLKISEGNIKFNANTTSYKTTVKYNISSIKVEATLTDESSSFVSGYGPREVKLKVGTNNIEIRVKAENETVKTYKIAVTREPDPNDVRSDNNYLSELVLSEGNITFDKETLEYSVTVLNEIEKIEVTAKAEDAKSKVKVNVPEKLVVGTNEITVVVTAENGSTREYKITVERKEENEVISGNTKLSSLSVDGYDINFNSEIYEYNLKIADEKSLIISYQQEDETSDVVIKGNEDLKNGSVITLNVTAEDGSTQVYKINIQKEEETTNMFMYIIIGGVVLLLLIIIIVIASNSKKKKNKDSEEVSSNNVGFNDDLAINQNVMPQNMNMTYTQPQQPNVQTMQPDFSSQPVQNMQPNVPTQPVQGVEQNVNQQIVQNDSNMQNNNFF